MLIFFLAEFQIWNEDYKVGECCMQCNDSRNVFRLDYMVKLFHEFEKLPMRSQQSTSYLTALHKLNRKYSFSFQLSGWWCMWSTPKVLKWWLSPWRWALYHGVTCDFLKNLCICVNESIHWMSSQHGMLTNVKKDKNNLHPVWVWRN